MPNRSGVPSWRLAVVTGYHAEERSPDRACVKADNGPHSALRLAWARPSINNRLGPEVKRPADVVKPGDVVYVEALAGEGARRRTFGLRQVPAVNGAIVAMDPVTGHVRGAVRRLLLRLEPVQPRDAGDAAAGLRPSSPSSMPPRSTMATPRSRRVLDAPFAVEQGPFLPLWSPENYEAGEYLGLTTLRRGMELSRNVMTVRLAQRYRHGEVAETGASGWASTTSCRASSPMSLGAGETTLLKMTAG